MTKRATEYESFGFFGPAYSNQPTVITTGGSTPLILVHPPPCGEQLSADLDVTLYMVIGERIRHEKKLNWERQRTKRAKNELVMAEQDQLQVPPQQFTRKARNKYADDTEERRVKRLQKFLRQDTIDTLIDAGSDTASETSDTTSNDEESVAPERSDSSHRDGNRHQPKLRLVLAQVKNFVDLISLIMAVMLGYTWLLFV